MADVRNDQYLHRPTAGRGAITAQDPLEVLLHSGGQPISGTNRLPVEATLTGSSVPDSQPLPIRVITQAHDSWDFNDQAQITIAAGVEVSETVARPVNGFGRLIVLVRAIPGDAIPVRVVARWQSVPGGPNANRSALEVLHDSNLGVGGSVILEASTKAQYLIVLVQNKHTVDHDFHIHMMLTIA